MTEDIRMAFEVFMVVGISACAIEILKLLTHFFDESYIACVKRIKESGNTVDVRIGFA